jgi:hypothetical protein
MRIFGWGFVRSLMYCDVAHRCMLGLGVRQGVILLQRKVPW